MNTIPGYDPDPGWQPNRGQLAWTFNFISMMRDGGTWAVPASGCVYTLDKKNQTLWLESGSADNEVHQRTVITFGLLGWKVQSRSAPPSAGDEMTVTETLWRSCSEKR